jgi:SNF2 family DNA or RNA helicase
MDVAWAEDIQKYAPQLTVSLAYAENREKAFQMKTDVVVMNHDAVKWLDDKKNVKYLAQFDHLVIDEGNAYKNPKSQRSKAMVRLRKYFEWRRLLTGTPNPNSVMELWNPAMIVDDGKRLGNSYFKLRSSVQSPTQVGPSANMIRWDDKPGATQAVNELIGDITIRHAFEDVMTHVPPNHRHTKTFKLSPKTRKIYDKLENDFVAEFDNKDYVDAVHAAALRTKLLQIASGAVYTSTDEDSGYTLVDTTRYDLIADLVEEREHCVVFFNWRHQRDYLVKAFAARDMSCAVIDGSVSKDARIQIVKDYQAGKYKVILLHPRTGAHGLTLTMGTTTIFSSPIYEADLMEQGIARIVRGMQDKVTNTIFIEADNTVEAGVYARLNKKAFNMNDLLDLMRQRKKR